MNYRPRRADGPVPRHRLKNLRAKVVAAVACVALAGGAVGGVTLPAHADIASTTYGPGLVANVQGFTLHITALIDNNGNIWYCPDPNLPIPSGVTGATTQATGGYVNAQGDAVSATTMQQVSALLYQFGWTTDNNQAAATFLALRSMLGLSAAPIEGSSWKPSWILTDTTSLGYQIATQLGVLQQALNEIAWAQANYNPGWDGSGTLNSNYAYGAIVTPGSTWTMTASLPGIGAGRAVAFNVTDPTGAVTTTTINTDANGNAVLSKVIPATPRGNYSVTANLVNGMPPEWATIQPASGMQSVLLSGGQPLAWSQPDPITVQGGKFTPSISTTPQATTVVVGQSNTDTATGNCLPGDTVAGTVDLYDGFADDATALAADVSTLTSSGQGTFSTTCPASGTYAVTSTPVKVTKPGSAFFYEKLAETDTSEGAEQTSDGRKSELFTVEKFTPTVSTAPGKKLIMPGSTNTDTVTGTCYPGDTVAGTVDLYDGFSSDADALAADVTALTPDGTGTFTTTCPASGQFTVTSSAVKATKAGSAFFYETITGTTNSNSVEQTPGTRQTEMFTVGMPTFDTTLSGQLMTGDVTLSDTIDAHGLISDNPGLRVAFTGQIVGPVWPASGQTACPAAGDAAWDGAAVLSQINTVLDNSTISADGDATLAKQGEVTVPKAPVGCYSATVRMDVTLDNVSIGDSQQVAIVAVVNSAPGVPSETGVVVQPGIGTQIQSSTGFVLGGAVSDKVKFTGLVPNSAITYKWHADYGVAPQKPDGTCDWDNVKTVDSGDYTLDQSLIQSDGTATVSGVLPEPILATGCVGYQENMDVVYGGKTVVTADHPWGSPDQSATVGVPKVASQMRTPGGATLGQPASDDVTITGLAFPDKDTLTASWYTQYGVAPQDDAGNCLWDQVAVVSDATAPVTADLAQKDGSLVLTGVLPVASMDAAGCVGYAGRLTVTDTTTNTVLAEVDQPWGSENEYVKVGAASIQAGGAQASTGGSALASNKSLGLGLTAVLAMLACGAAYTARRRNSAIPAGTHQA